MNLSEGKKQFISSWGSFGTQWGISRAMGQVFALLLVSPDPITQDKIMEELSISRGSVNTTIRELIDWGLVERVIISGERKEYFLSEKDIWKASAQILNERKKRELDPLLKTLAILEKVEGDKKDKDFKHFTKTVKDIKKMSVSSDKIIKLITGTRGSYIVEKIMKMM